PLDTIGEAIHELLSAIQENLLETARARRERNSVRGNITHGRCGEIRDGDGEFVYAGWCGSAEGEAKIKDQTKATIRCLPDEEFRSAEAPATCLRCGEKSVAEALWAKAY